MKYTIAIIKNCDNKMFEIEEKEKIGKEAFAILTNVNADNETMGLLIKTILESGYGVAIKEE